MIFVGDIWPGSPNQVTVEWPKHLAGTVKCCNLESGLLNEAAALRPFCAKELEIAGLAATYSAAALANNHVADGLPVGEVRAACTRAGIAAFGGGDSAPEALRPATLIDRDGAVVHLLSFGWRVVGCKPGALNKSGVAPLASRLIIDSIRMLKAGDPLSKVAVYVHWGYELDAGPQPAHRDAAIAMLAAGADAIIGSHSHNVQAVELFGKKIIAHSLGNWLVPHGAMGGNTLLAYPDASRRQVALEIDFTTGESRCHWFRYQPEDRKIVFEGTLAPTKPSWGVATLCEPRSIDYEKWYGANRRTSVALPAFSSRDGRLKVFAKIAWIGMRHSAAKLVRRIQGRSYDRGQP